MRDLGFVGSHTRVTARAPGVDNRSRREPIPIRGDPERIHFPQILRERREGRAESAGRELGVARARACSRQLRLRVLQTLQKGPDHVFPAFQGRRERGGLGAGVSHHEARDAFVVAEALDRGEQVFAVGRVCAVL